MGKIDVTYKYIDGAHFFVSSDKDAAGLCVASPDLETAFTEVAKQLTALFAVNHGQDASFTPSMAFEDFKKWLDASWLIAKGASGMMTPGGVQPWMYDAAKVS